MAEYQLTHIALVGARISAFRPLGYTTRNELTMCRVAPLKAGAPLEHKVEQELRATLRDQLPLWIHNIITDPDFPQRHKLLMPLRRFEGELNDNKGDEVISAVLSNGFRSQDFNPLDLPGEMSVRERCAILAHVQTWQDAYLRLEEDLLDILSQNAVTLDRWSDYARHPDHMAVE